MIAQPSFLNLQPTDADVGKEVYVDVVEKRGTFLGGIHKRMVLGTEITFAVVRFPVCRSNSVFPIEEIELVPGQEKATASTVATQTKSQGEYTMFATETEQLPVFDIDAEIAKYQEDLSILEAKGTKPKALQTRVKTLKAIIKGLEDCKKFTRDTIVTHSFHGNGRVLGVFIDDRQIGMVTVRFSDGLEKDFAPNQLKVAEVQALPEASPHPVDKEERILSFVEQRASVPSDSEVIARQSELNELGTKISISEAYANASAIAEIAEQDDEDDEMSLPSESVESASVEVVGISDGDEFERLATEIEQIEKSRIFEVGRRLVRMEQLFVPSVEFPDFAKYAQSRFGYKQSYCYELKSAAQAQDVVSDSGVSGIALTSINQARPIAKMLNARVEPERVKELVAEVAATGELSKTRIEQAAQERGLLPKKEAKKPSAETQLKEQGQSLGLSGKESQQLPDIASNPDVPLHPTKRLEECQTMAQIVEAIASNPKSAFQDFCSADWQERFRLRELDPNIGQRLRGLESPDLPVSSTMMVLEISDRDSKIQWLESRVAELEAKLQKPASTRTDEWYTPPEFIEMAREVMGSIDLDPASNELAQSWIKAAKFYTKDDDGLRCDWGQETNIWCNPPYGRAVEDWLDLATDLYQDGEIKSAILLLNRTGAAWYKASIKGVSAICEAYKRIAFIDENGQRQDSPRYYSDFLYLGEDVEKFKQVFSAIGDVRVMEPQQQEQQAA